nr:aldehyde dehydrogenase family protein [Tessaracoccus coleopterorum]
MPAGAPGTDAVAGARLGDADGVRALIARTAEAGRAWARRPAAERAGLLHRLGAELEAARGDLITVAADEAGKLIDQADVEVSEACDFAHYYATLAGSGPEGAVHVPPR